MKTKKKSILISLTEDEIKKANEMADKEGLSRSTFIGRLIKENHILMQVLIVVIVTSVLFTITPNPFDIIFYKKTDNMDRTNYLYSSGTNHDINFSDFYTLELTYFRLPTNGESHVINSSDFKGIKLEYYP